MTDHPPAIGVDLGATKIASALVDRSGRVIASRHARTDAADGPSAVCDRIAGEIRALLEKSPTRLAGVGIGSPGIVDSGRGIVRGAVNLGWDEVDLRTEVGRRINGLPVFVENDANVNAVGEGMFGSAVGSRDYVLLTVGSGLGAGIVSDGRLITGAGWIAADLGHYAVDPGRGPLCACGRRGCAETVVSGPGLVAMVRSVRAAAGGRQSPTGKAFDLTPDAIVAAARAGGPGAAGAIGIMATWLGEVAAVAAAVVNPDVIVVGGGLGTAAFDLLKPGAEAAMYRRLPRTYEGTVQWRAATLPSPAVGSACLVWLNER